MGVDGMNSADIFDEYFDEKKPKYIVRNCPAYQTFYSDTTNGSSSTLCTKGFTKLYCQDCTDCVLKQIVELCKKEKTLYEGDYIKVRQRTLISSDKILELLDIQEVK